MFGLFGKKTEKNTGIVATEIIKIGGMHCSSCSLNIDGALEDSDGVISASTNYAKSQTTVAFDPQKITREKMHKIIRELGYTIV